MKSPKGRKGGDAAEPQDQKDADDASSYLEGDVVDRYAADESTEASVDRRGLLKRGALVAGLVGLGAAALEAQGNQPPGQSKDKVMKAASPPVWSLWWRRFKWTKGTRAPVWARGTPANACTPNCCFTPANPCTALCQTPGDNCTQECIMTPEPPPINPVAAVSPSDPCTPGCVTEGSVEQCTPGCVTEGSVELCTPGC
jgi:hypothetical protein